MAATWQHLKTGGAAFILNDEWGHAVTEKARQALVANAFRTFDLGGTQGGGVDGTGALDADEWKPVVLTGANLQGFTVQARVRVKTDLAGTTVTPKIRDITNSTDVATGTASASLTFAEQLLAITLPAATREYRLMLVKANGDALVYGFGQIELHVP